MLDRNLPCDPASESPALARLVDRAWEPLSRAVRGRARWYPWNRHRSLPGWRAALSRTLRGRYGCCGLSGSAQRRGAPSSSSRSSTTSTCKLGSLKHVAVAAFILVSGQTAAYHDHVWCTGGTKFVDMTNCVVWEEGDEFSFTPRNRFSARNTCNEYMNLTVCWTGHEFPDSNFRCDKSHPIPPAPWAGLKPGESTTALKGEFVWWAWRCEE